MCFYFYCPRCGYQELVSKLPRFGTVVNCRDGWGIPINHYKCPKCGNLDAGFMLQQTATYEEKVYFSYVISKYQNIRTKEPEYIQERDYKIPTPTIGYGNTRCRSDRLPRRLRRM